MGIGAVLSSESEWRYRPENSELERGVQIDLLLEPRRISRINLFEIKNVNGEFVIDKDYAEELRAKKRLIPQMST